MSQRDQWAGAAGSQSASGVARLTEMVEQLRAAMFGLAERELPDDPLPCFCVRYERDSGVHDEWCVDARLALAATDGIGTTDQETDYSRRMG